MRLPVWGHHHRWIERFQWFGCYRGDEAIAGNASDESVDPVEIEAMILAQVILLQELAR